VLWWLAISSRVQFDVPDGPTLDQRRAERLHTLTLRRLNGHPLGNERKAFVRLLKAIDPGTPPTLRVSAEELAPDVIAGGDVAINATALRYGTLDVRASSVGYPIIGRLEPSRPGAQAPFNILLGEPL
jgi:hypothetical protein